MLNNSTFQSSGIMDWQDLGSLMMSRMLCSTPQSTARMASHSGLLSQLRLNLPSFFVWPIVGSMAPRHLIIALSPRVTPRRWPDFQVHTASPVHRDSRGQRTPLAVWIRRGFWSAPPVERHRFKLAPLSHDLLIRKTKCMLEVEQSRDETRPRNRAGRS